MNKIIKELSTLWQEYTNEYWKIYNEMCDEGQKKYEEDRKISKFASAFRAPDARVTVEGFFDWLVKKSKIIESINYGPIDASNISASDSSIKLDDDGITIGNVTITGGYTTDLIRKDTIEKLMFLRPTHGIEYTTQEIIDFDKLLKQRAKDVFNLDIK